MPCYLLISATQITRVIMVYLTCHLVTVRCCCSDTKSFLTLYNPNDCSMPGSPVLYYVPEFAETHVLCFTALDFTFTTGYIHNWLSFPLWPSCFILSGAISNCPLLFPSSILDTFWPGSRIFPCHIFLPFHTVHGVLTTGILEWVAISSSHRSRYVWALHYNPSLLGGPPCMAYSFIEVCKSSLHDKALIHEGEQCLIVFFLYFASVYINWYIILSS